MKLKDENVWKEGADRRNSVNFEGKGGSSELKKLDDKLKAGEGTSISSIRRSTVKKNQRKGGESGEICLEGVKQFFSDKADWIDPVLSSVYSGHGC